MKEVCGYSYRLFASKCIIIVIDTVTHCQTVQDKSLPGTAILVSDRPVLVASQKSFTFHCPVVCYMVKGVKYTLWY